MTDKLTMTLLSLEKQPWLDEMYGSLFASLRSKADVSEITTAKEVDELLGSSQKPRIILATDGALTTTKFAKQRDAVVQYVRK